MQLPLISDPKVAQTKWKSILDPLLAQPISSSQILTGIVVVNGTNVINHRLGRLMQGWIVTDVQSSVILYRSAPFNDTTFTLSSNGSSIINLLVF